MEEEDIELYDYELEAPFDEDLKTPVNEPITGDPCLGCRLRAFVRMTNLVPPPTSIHEAARFTSCVSPIHGLWYVCAVGPFIGIPSMNVKIYFGPERRSATRQDPNFPDRRVPPSPPKESVK